MTRYFGDAFRIVRSASIRAPADRLVIVFQCYLDDSGTSGLPIVTMAGFAAPLSQWEHLEPVWDEILNGYEVPVLHAKEFHDTKGYFKKWSKIKKQTLTEDLFSAAHGRMLGLSVSARKEAFAAEKIQTGLVPTMSAYGVCFSTLVYRIVMEPQIGSVVRQSGVSFLVESGNKNNSELENWFHQMAKHPNFKGCLRSMSIIPKDNCRAIQIVDFFAFYSRRHMRDHDRFSGKFQLPMSAHLEIMHKHVPVWQWTATGFLKHPVGNLRDLPAFDDLSFWGRGGAAGKS